MTRRETKINASHEPSAKTLRDFAPRTHALDLAEANEGLREPIVFVRDDGPRTTSREVAEFFGRRHDDVLKAIRRLSCSADFRARNFAETVSKVKVGTAYRDLPGFELTKDGFTFLAFGFTGHGAGRFKEAYIAAFNRMEAMLTGHALAGPDSIALQVERLVTLQLEADPRVAVLNYRLPLDVLRNAGVPARGRRGFSNTVRGKLLRFCQDRDIPIRRSPETDRQMFHVDAIEAWLKAEGNRLIAERLDQIGRQGVLKLVA